MTGTTFQSTVNALTTSWCADFKTARTQLFIEDSEAKDRERKLLLEEIHTGKDAVKEVGDWIQVRAAVFAVLLRPACLVLTRATVCLSANAASVCGLGRCQVRGGTEPRGH